MGDRIDRVRQAESDDAIGRIDRESAPRPGPIVVVTVTVATYPTAAQSYYAVQAVDVSGAETEGGAVTLTAGGNVLYAANVGATVPAVGTQVIAHPVSSGRLAFRYG